jgi:hypothetical protein
MKAAEGACVLGVNPAYCTGAMECMFTWQPNGALVYTLEANGAKVRRPWLPWRLVRHNRRVAEVHPTLT